MYEPTSEAWHNVNFLLAVHTVPQGPPAPEPVEETFTCEPLGIAPEDE